MRRKIYISLLALGFACMAVTIVISSWLFWRAMQRQAAEEMEVALTIMAQSAYRPARRLFAADSGKTQRNHTNHLD